LYWRLWKGAAANCAAGLDTAVKSLRKALVKVGAAGVSIETLPKRGYRLVATNAGQTGSVALSPGSEADRLYLEGYHCWHKRTPSSDRNALRFFERARDLEPRDARHYSAIAVAQILLASQGDRSPLELISEAESAAVQCIQIDSSDAMAYCVLGYIKGAFRFDLAGALQELARAVELSPRIPLSYIPYSYVLTAVGRFGEARRMLETAHALDPAAPSINALRGFAAYLAGDFEGAIVLGDYATGRDPEFGLGRFYHGQALLAADRISDATRQFEAAAELLEGQTPARAMLGAASAMSGNRARAMRIDEELDAAAEAGYADPYHRAILKYLLGSRKMAIDLLEDARENHSHWFAIAKIDPKLQRMRDDGRVVRLLQRLRLS
jgi:tetratricopeptide (TPR) repeat protein